MGAALIVDAAVATMASSAAKKAATAGAGSTLTVRASAPTSNVSLTGLWAETTAAGEIQLTSPALVPVSNGIDVKVPAGLSDPLLPANPTQALTPQDTLTMNLLDGNGDIAVGCIQSYYTDVSGSAMVLKSPGDIQGQAEYVFGWAVAAAAPATEGDQGEVVITTTYDSSEANRWYAVLGYVVDAQLAAVGIKGSDTSQLFVGGPGDTDSLKTRNYFQELSVATGLPCIPLFNAANKANTNVVAVSNGASTTANVTLILAEMPTNWTP